MIFLSVSCGSEIDAEQNPTLLHYGIQALATGMTEYKCDEAEQTCKEVSYLTATLKTPCLSGMQELPKQMP